METSMLQGLDEGIVEWPTTTKTTTSGGGGGSGLVEANHDSLRKFYQSLGVDVQEEDAFDNDDEDDDDDDSDSDEEIEEEESLKDIDFDIELPQRRRPIIVAPTLRMNSCNSDRPLLDRVDDNVSRKVWSDCSPGGPIPERVVNRTMDQEALETKATKLRPIFETQLNATQVQIGFPLYPCPPPSRNITTTNTNTNNFVVVDPLLQPVPRAYKNGVQRGYLVHLLDKTTRFIGANSNGKGFSDNSLRGGSKTIQDFHFETGLPYEVVNVKEQVKQECRVSTTTSGGSSPAPLIKKTSTRVITIRKNPKFIQCHDQVKRLQQPLQDPHRFPTTVVAEQKTLTTNAGTFTTKTATSNVVKTATTAATDVASAAARGSAANAVNAAKTGAAATIDSVKSSGIDKVDNVTTKGTGGGGTATTIATTTTTTPTYDVLADILELQIVDDTTWRKLCVLLSERWSTQKADILKSLETWSSSVLFMPELANSANITTTTTNTNIGGLVEGQGCNGGGNSYDVRARLDTQQLETMHKLYGSVKTTLNMVDNPAYLIALIYALTGWMTSLEWVPVFAKLFETARGQDQGFCAADPRVIAPAWTQYIVLQHTTSYYTRVLAMHSELDAEMLMAHLFQLVFGLDYAQHVLGFIHHNLDIATAIGCVCVPPKTYLYYQWHGTWYRVPTYGWIMKIVALEQASIHVNRKRLGATTNNTNIRCDLANASVSAPSYNTDLVRLGATLLKVLQEKQMKLTSPHPSVQQNLLTMLDKWVSCMQSSNSASSSSSSSSSWIDVNSYCERAQDMNAYRTKCLQQSGPKWQMFFEVPHHDTCTKALPRNQTQCFEMFAVTREQVPSNAMVYQLN